MGFDLDPNGKEVAELRQNYSGRTPAFTELLGATEYLQNEYFNGEVAAVGNVTNYSGAHTTDTRRPLSASIDMVFRDLDLDEVGETYPSWEFMDSYFFDFVYVSDLEERSDLHLEVALIDVDAFPLFDFDPSVVAEGYTETMVAEEPGNGWTHEYDIRLAKPEQSVASKFNRLNNIANKRGGIVKGSDSIDMANHLHWGHTTGGMDIEELAETIEEKVEGPYNQAVNSIRESKENFSKGEREDLETAVNNFSEHLGVVDE